MAFLAGGFGAALSAVGTIVGGIASMAAGNAQKAAMNFRAKQEEIAANEARATATRQVEEDRRKGALVQSTLIARAAGSGAGATDPTVLQLGQDIAGRSEYNALYDMYSGESKARGLEDAATADRATGDAYVAQGIGGAIGSVFRAGGTIMGGAGSMYKSYGANSLDDYLYGQSGRALGYG